jgi:hypothetical protein
MIIKTIKYTVGFMLIFGLWFLAEMAIYKIWPLPPKLGPALYQSIQQQVVRAYNHGAADAALLLPMHPEQDLGFHFNNKKFAAAIRKRLLQPAYELGYRDQLRGIRREWQEYIIPPGYGYSPRI